MRVKRMQRQQVRLHHHFLGYLSATHMGEQSLCLAVTSQHCSFCCSLGFRYGCHLPPASLGRPLSASKSFCIRLQMADLQKVVVLSGVRSSLLDTCLQIFVGGDRKNPTRFRGPWIKLVLPGVRRVRFLVPSFNVGAEENSFKVSALTVLVFVF